MAKGQKELQQKADQRSDQQFATATEAQKRLVDGSPEFQAKKAQVAERRKSVDSGTIAERSDFIGNKSFVAERNAQREAKANLAKSGVAGLASNYANPTQIALAKQVIDDEWARDSATQQEQDALNYINETNAMENDIINAEANADASVMNSAFGVSQAQQDLAARISASRSSVLPAILGAFAGGVSLVATAGTGAWFNRAPVATAGAH